VKPVRCPRSRIQALSCRASATDRFFLFDFLKRSGAMSLSPRPKSQPEDQKEALCPSPRVIVVQAAKSNLSCLVQGTSVPTHALSGEVHSCQSHHSWSAEANLWRLRMPRSPNFFGSDVFVQLTLHFPPERALSPAKGNVCEACRCRQGLLSAV
jgi:hypothetical protein